MSFNIFGGHDLERRSNLTRVAALIDSVGADLVLLQEVDRLTVRSGRVDQAARLADLTGMQAIFGRAMDFDGGEYGIAVLSRWPVGLRRIVSLVPAHDSTRAAPEPRVLLHAVADLPGGALHILNTHLDHQANAAARHAQLLQALAYVADSVPRTAAVIFGGDLNASPDAPEVRALGIAFDNAWARCGTGAGLTFRSDAPTRRIDHLLLMRARCTRALVPATTISDHRPLLVDVVISK